MLRMKVARMVCSWTYANCSQGKPRFSICAEATFISSNSTHALADTPMSSGAERLVGRLGPLADSSVTVIDLVSTVVILQGLVSYTLLVDPSVRVPDGRILPDGRVHLGNTGGGEDEVALGDNIRSVLLGDGRSGDGGRNGHVRHDFAHNRAVDDGSKISVRSR